MTEEREKYLVENFPLIYKKEEGSNDPYSLFGFECGDGWFRILYWLSKHIQNKIDQNNRWAEKYPDQYKKIEQVKAVQVKEKFGGLRFYYYFYHGVLIFNYFLDSACGVLRHRQI